jgi:hypothetical protein
VIGTRIRIHRTVLAGAGLLALSLVALTQAVAAKGPSSTAAAPACPSFSAGNFHNPTKITNQYFPLKPGDLYTYKGNSKKVPVVDTVYVTRNTATIAGVTTVEVRDRVYESDVLTEDTLDWYAQDDRGNVWYVGEDTTEYEDGRPVTKEGSWEAGVDGAKAGIIMPARPRVGMQYRQEYYAGHAEDMARVLSLDEQAEVPAGHFTDALLTREWNPIEPEVLEYKLYAKGIGPVLAVSVSGGRDREELLPQ